MTNMQKLIAAATCWVKVGGKASGEVDELYRRIALLEGLLRKSYYTMAGKVELSDPIFDEINEALPKVKPYNGKDVKQ